MPAWTAQQAQHQAACSEAATSWPTSSLQPGGLLARATAALPPPQPSVHRGQSPRDGRRLHQHRHCSCRRLPTASLPCMPRSSSSGGGGSRRRTQCWRRSRVDSGRWMLRRWMWTLAWRRCCSAWCSSSTCSPRWDRCRGLGSAGLSLSMLQVRAHANDLALIPNDLVPMPNTRLPACLPAFRCCRQWQRWRSA